MNEMCWVLHIPEASVDRLLSWPGWGLKKWVFKCLLQRHWLWVPQSPNAMGTSQGVTACVLGADGALQRSRGGGAITLIGTCSLTPALTPMAGLWVDQLTVSSLGFYVKPGWLLRGWWQLQIWYYLVKVEYYSFLEVCVWLERWKYFLS